jgi:DNA polymerase-3 subunit epsilon
VNLTRPLASLDLETTGTDPATSRVVEVGIVKRYPDDCEEVFRWLVNPEVTIPSESIRVHGYTNEIARIQPPFAAVADDIAATLAGCDLVVFNGRAFDLPLLRAEFARCGVAWPCDDAHVIDAFVIYRERERRDLPAAVRFYCGREHVGAHGAVADARAALDVAFAQVARYPDLADLDVAALDLASGGRQPTWATDDGKVRWGVDGRAVWGFGKLAGKPVASDRGFAAWVMRNDFADDVKALVARVLNGEDVRRA